MQDEELAIVVGLFVDMISVKKRVVEPVLFSFWSKMYHEFTKTNQFKIQRKNTSKVIRHHLA